MKVDIAVFLQTENCCGPRCDPVIYHAIVRSANIIAESKRNVNIFRNISAGISICVSILRYYAIICRFLRFL